MAAVTEGNISTSDLPSYVLDGLFDSFGEQTISDGDYIRNYNNVDELNNKTDQLVLIDTRMPMDVMIKVTE